MAGRSANTNRNGGEASIRAWPTSYSETSALEFHRLEIAIVSYIRIEYRRPFRGFSGFRMEVGRPGGRKNGREGGEATRGGEERSGNDKDKGGGGQEVSAPLLRPFRKSPGMRAMPLYRVSLFLSL